MVASHRPSNNTTEPIAAALILNGNLPEVATTMAQMVPCGEFKPRSHFEPSITLANRPGIAVAVRSSRRWSAMLFGGSDALHLGDHLRSLLLNPRPNEARLYNGDAPTAPNIHLLLPNGHGWSETLRRTGDRLPARVDRRS
jgi:hypothetical protein